MQTPSVVANLTSQTYTTQLDLLQPATVYFYRIESRNRFESRVTGERSFTTRDSSKCNTHSMMQLQLQLSMVPVDIVSSRVSDIRSSNPSDTTLLISWDIPAIPNGMIMNYSINISNLANGEIVTRDNTVGTSFTQSDLGIL